MVTRAARLATSSVVVIAGVLALAGMARPIGAASTRTARSHVAAKTATPSPAAGAATAIDTAGEAMNPYVYMSWHRPYGMPGATSDLTPSTEPGQRDTLWLLAEPRRSSRLIGIRVQLAFHAAPGDTLDSLWRFGGTDENSRHVRVEFPQPSWPVKDPWNIAGYGGVRYDRRGDYGWLDIIYAVASDSAPPVQAGTRYALARVLFPPMSPAVAKRPICIEWAGGEWGYSVSSEVAEPAIGGARFVSVWSPDGSVCTPQRVAQKINPFRYRIPDSPASPPGH